MRNTTEKALTTGSKAAEKESAIMRNDWRRAKMRKTRKIRRSRRTVIPGQFVLMRLTTDTADMGQEGGGDIGQQQRRF